MRYRLLILLIATVSFSYGQGGFSKNYVHSNSIVSLCTDVLETPSANIIMTGLTMDTLTGANRLTIFATDAMGVPLWRKDYGNSNLDYRQNVLMTRSSIKDKSCFYFYSTVRDSNYNYFSVVIKFNYNGDTLWQKKFVDSSGYLYVQSLSKSVDNAFLITGIVEASNRSTILIKIDTLGNELWRKKINKPVPDVQSGQRLIQDSATKKIVIVGYQYNGTANYFTGYANIIVTDSLGMVLQRKAFTGGCASLFKDLIQTKDKKCIAVGNKDQCNNLGGPNGSNRFKSYAVKFDLNNLNNVSWIKEFDTLSIYNSFHTINELPSGNLILGGVLDTLSNYFINDKPMLRLIKLDKNGNVIWNKKFSRDNENLNGKYMRSLNLTANGSYLTANELLHAVNPRPYSITKIDSLGCDSTIAYCYSVGSEERIFNKNIIEVYPNPTRGILHFKGITDFSNVHGRLLNVLGQEVLDFKNEVQLDISNLKSGVYFLQVFTSDQIITFEKIIKE